jgi:hypothetical protein
MSCMFEVKDVFQLVIDSYNDTAFTQGQQHLLGDEPLGPAKDLFCPCEKERRRLHRFIGAHFEKVTFNFDLFDRPVNYNADILG